MKNWNKFCEAASEFRLAGEHLESIRDFYEKTDAAFFDAMYAKLPDSVPQQEIESKYPNGEYRKFYFILIASAWEKLKKLYQSKGYPESILEDIRLDLRCWAEKSMEDFGFAGLDRRIFQWENGILSGRTMQFGRLQCNIPAVFSPELSFVREASGFRAVPGKAPAAGSALSYGDPVINLHIPAAGPLRRDLCLDSLRKMHDFGAEFLPDFDYRAFVCYSWILDPVFQKISPNSNLVTFQKLGHLFALPADQTREVIWRVFGRAGAEKGIDHVPCRTSMQKAVASHLKNGGKFTEYGFFILKEEAASLFRENLA